MSGIIVNVLASVSPTIKSSRLNIIESINFIVLPVADKLREYKGKVTKIYSKAFQEGGETNIPVEISVSDSDGLLIPDFNVDVKIQIDGK